MIRRRARPLTVGKILWIEFGLSVTGVLVFVPSVILRGQLWLAVVFLLGPFSMPFTLGYFWRSPRMDGPSRSLAKCVTLFLASIVSIAAAMQMIGSRVSIADVAYILALVAGFAFVPFLAGRGVWHWLNRVKSKRE